MPQRLGIDVDVLMAWSAGFSPCLCPVVPSRVWQAAKLSALSCLVDFRMPTDDSRRCLAVVRALRKCILNPSVRFGSSLFARWPLAISCH